MKHPLPMLLLSTGACLTTTLLSGAALAERPCDFAIPPHSEDGARELVEMLIPPEARQHVDAIGIDRSVVHFEVTVSGRTCEIHVRHASCAVGDDPAGAAVACAIDCGDDAPPPRAIASRCESVTSSPVPWKRLRSPDSPSPRTSDCEWGAAPEVTNAIIRFVRREPRDSRCELGRLETDSGRFRLTIRVDGREGEPVQAAPRGACTTADDGQEPATYVTTIPTSIQDACPLLTKRVRCAFGQADVTSCAPEAREIAARRAEAVSDSRDAGRAALNLVHIALGSAFLLLFCVPALAVLIRATHRRRSSTRSTGSGA
ncbi:MAG: hypothetical protein ACQEXJ_22345 [Myxococcota bacterium]